MGTIYQLTTILSTGFEQCPERVLISAWLKLKELKDSCRLKAGRTIVALPKQYGAIDSCLTENQCMAVNTVRIKRSDYNTFLWTIGRKTMLQTRFHPYHWESRECTKYLFYGRCLCRWLLSLMSPYFFDWATIVPATPFFSSGGKNIFLGRKINLPREEPYLFSSFSLSVVLDSGQPGRNRNRTGLSSLRGMFIPFAVNWYIVPFF